ncbi:MAG: ATP-binding protein [Patescibacteria group bacterium]
MGFNVFGVHNAILIGVLLFSIGLWIYFGNRNRASNITMSSILVVVAFWSFAHVLWRASSEPGQILFWLRVLVLISSFLPAFLLFHVLALYKGRMPTASIQAAAILPNVVSFWLIYGTDTVIALNDENQTVFGSGGFILGLFFGVMFLLSLLFLLLAARKKNGIDRRSLIATFGGSILAFNTVFAVLVTLSTYHDLRAFWIANIALAIGSLIIAAPTIGKTMLKDLRLIGGELLILLIVTLVVTDVVVSETLLDFTFRLVLLIVIVFYGVLTLRSMVREVNRLHQVEKMTRKLNYVNHQLMTADKMKTRFLSFASHQLRSPLSGISSYLSMLADGDFGKLTAKQKDIIEMNMEAMGRLRDTIETFLDVSKIEMGGLELDTAETHLDLLAADVVREKNILAVKKGLKLELEIAKSLPSVMADSGKLYHAIANLIDNAIKYTDSGKIVVSVQSENSEVTIAVSDTGHGMTGEMLKKLELIMEHGLEEIRFDKEGGSGLGIHIARKIIEGHGGALTVASSGPGKGSTFTVHIPKN